METNGEKLYRLAKESINKDISPTQNALSCAESVSTLLNRVSKDIRVVTGTYTLLEELIKNCDEITHEVPYSIIISATGTQPKNSPLEHGHVGIVGKNLSPDGTLYVMSSDYRSGLWTVNFTVKKFIYYYRTFGKFPVRYFKIK